MGGAAERGQAAERFILLGALSAPGGALRLKRPPPALLGVATIVVSDEALALAPSRS